MNINKYLFFSLVFELLANTVKAQNLGDAFLRQHLEKKVYSLDVDADAVILNEKTKTKIEDNMIVGFEQITHVYECIKVLKPTAIQMHIADISTGYVYSRNCGVNNIIATTYNIEEGVIKKASLASNAVFKKTNGDYCETVFTMPDVRVGSIIEYSYEIKTPVMYYPRSWIIQGPYPKLQSEYEIVSPRNFNYTNISQISLGNEPFQDYNSKKETENDSVTSYHVLVKMTDGWSSVLWGKRNIPSVNEEPFICNIINHRDRLDLQIAGMNFGAFSYNQVILSTWEKLNDAVWNNSNFGAKIKEPNKFLNKLVDSLTTGDTSALGKTRSIYNYVRKNISCNNNLGAFSTEDIRKILENKRGNVADINLLLSAMLDKAGINVSPVILSTLGNLRINPSYPLLNRFNYAVCMVTIDSARYFFDASDKFNPFGILPIYCYNGYARIIDKHGDELFMSPDDLKERNVCVVNVNGIGDSLYKINVAEKHGMYSSMSLRKQWNGDSAALHNYVKKQTETFTGNVSVTDMSAINLENADTNLIIKYTLTIATGRADIIYLNSDLSKFYNENPFKATNRKLPIEFPSKIEDVYVMTARLPENMEAEDIPKPSIVKYDDDNIIFKHLVNYDSSSRVISVNTNFSVSKTNFDVKEYSTIRDFFETMITNENSMLVLKKIKDK